MPSRPAVARLDSLRVNGTRVTRGVVAAVGALGLLGVLVVPRTARAQKPDSAVALRPVSVTTTRAGRRPSLELPFALSRTIPDSVRPALRRSGVGDLLFAVPGVLVQERANPSQDPRLSIRGFGSRSAFGVRGVRVLRDGIPLSLPDGQTPLDWLDLESVGEVEVIRGTASALFGNAAGGVAAFHTRAVPRDRLDGGVRAWQGGGLSRWSVAASTATAANDPASDAARGAADGAGTADRSLLASFTRTRGDGARQWSRQDVTSAFVRARAAIGGTQLELQGTRYDNARAENTGALTAAELTRDPRLPDSLNITKRSRKAVEHAQLALLASHRRRALDIDASVFTGTRSLDNPLPFSIVGVERRSGGASLRIGTTRRGALAGVRALRLSTGVDAQWQQDDRANWENCADVPSSAAATARCPTRGAERGALRLDQREDVDGLGAHARAEAELPARVFVSGAVRFDRVHFGVGDRFVTSENGDDSGTRTLSAYTPMAGVVWRVRPLASVYANWSGAFETPTITELTNQPDGRSGLNADIAPQRTRTLEVGTEGWYGAHLHGDVAAYVARVTGELVSFDVPNAPGRRAFRNTGRTARRGVESSLRFRASYLDAGAAYTWSHFRFVDYVVGTTSYAGNTIPGVPEHQLHGYLTPRWRGAFATFESRMASRLVANDAGTVAAAGHAVWNLRAGHPLPLGAWAAGDLVLGIENLFDRHYAPSVVTNATRGRYFEPGYRRQVSLTVSLRTR